MIGKLQRSLKGDLSIRWWLGLLCIGTATLVLAVATAGFIAMESLNARREARREVSMLAEMLSAHVAGALAFGDEVVAAESLESLRANTRMRLACLYDAERIELARLSIGDESGERPCPAATPSEARFDGNTIGLTREIRLADEPVGAIHLESRLEALSSRIAGKAAVGAPLLFCAGFVSLLFAARFQRRIADPISALVDGANSLSSGNLEVSPETSGVREVAALSDAFEVMAGNLRSVVGHTQRTMTEVAQSVTLLRASSHQLSADARGQADAVSDSARSLEELGSSNRSVSESAEILTRVARETEDSRSSIDDGVREVLQHADQLQAVVDGTATSITQMKSSINSTAESLTPLHESAEQTVRSAQELKESVESVAEFTIRCDELASGTAREAETGQRVVDETIEEARLIRARFKDIQEIVAKLSGESEAIDRFVQIIGDVADEASLLSLNARIIAAQAGDSGRSFSVVADQMSTLAARTADSTREIQALVQSVQACTKDTVELVETGSKQMDRGVGKWEEAGRVLGGIEEIANRSAETASRIAEATRTQGAELGRVSEDAARVLTMTDKIAAATDEQRGASQGIEETAQHLRDLADSLQRITAAQDVESQRIGSTRQQIEAIAGAIQEQGSHREQLERALDTFRKGAMVSAEQAEKLERIVSDLAVRSGEAEEAVARFRL